MSNEITIVAPQNIEESEKLSATLAKSTLLPEALRGKPGDILATLLTGAELGLAPMQSLRAIQIIKGKPTLSAELMGALVKRRKDVCEFLRLSFSNDTKATYITKRVGDTESTTMEFSAADATRAGLNGDNWRKYPAAMLRARCLSAICKAVYPDVTLGLYDSDSAELGEPPPVAPPPEKDVTPGPATLAFKEKAIAAAKSVVEGKRVAAPEPVAAKVSRIIDVEKGQTEAEAEAKKQAPTRYPIWERMIALGHKYGKDEKATVGLLKTYCPGKMKLPELTEADFQAMEKGLIATATEPPADI